MKKRTFLFITLTFIVSLVLASCQDGASNVVVPTQAATSEITVPATETVASQVASPTALSATIAPTKTPVPDVTATAVATAVVTTAPADEPALEKPGMPDFVMNSDGLTTCVANLDYSNAVGVDIESGFTTTGWQPAFDDRYDTVVFSVNGADNFVSYYVRGSGDTYLWPAENSTYIIVRFNKNDCGIQTLIDWADDHLDEAEVWAAQFDAWLEASHQPVDGQLESAVIETVSPEVPCQFDESPNAYIITGEGVGGTNIVVVNPKWEPIGITSDDKEISLGNVSIVDGCGRRSFSVPQYHGPMQLSVWAWDGTKLDNYNFHLEGGVHVKFGQNGDQFTAPK